MTTVTAARHDWEEGDRRFAVAVRDPARADALHEQRDVVVEELRRRIGGRFTLAELASLYAGSERWVREAIEERAPSAGWARTATLAADAAFHSYSRLAQDYEP
jgi:hypothetical protein